MLVSEEAQDLPQEPSKRIDPETVEIKPQLAKPEPYPADRFEQNLPKWRELVETGKKTPEDIIATVSGKAALTPEQIAAIRDLAVTDVEPKSESDDWLAEPEGAQA